MVAAPHPSAPRPRRAAAAPIGGRGTASSRLRLFALLEALGPRISFTVFAPGDPLPDPAAYDLLYVQKAAWENVVRWCERASAAGVPVIYDVDDDFGCWPGMREGDLCALARAVTVDSPGRAAEVQRVTAAPVHVVPCMIDLADDPSRAAPPAPRASIRTVCTFGNAVSVAAAVPYLEALRAPRVETVVVGPPGADLPAGGRLVEFALDSFVGALRNADVAVLCHPRETGSRKDNNRLVMAMSLGLPALVSPSQSYVETLEDAGLPELVCRGPDDAARLLDALAPADRRAEIGERFARYAWERYAPARCAAQFWAVVEEAIRP